MTQNVVSEAAITKLKRDLPAWGLSLLMNVSILACLNFVVMETARQSESVSTIVGDLTDITSEDRVEFSDAVATDQVGSAGFTGGLPPSVSAATSVGSSDQSVTEQVEEMLTPQLVSLSEASMPRIEQGISTNVQTRGGTDSATGGGSGSVQGAMDRVAFEIRQSLRERQTLVVWLMDASLSLNHRRAAIADRFENIYKQLGNDGNTDGLHSMIVSYGQKTDILTPEPIQDVTKLSDIVRTKIVPDESGKELVFGAMKQVLEKYRTWHKGSGQWNRIVIIVTDERGDDAEQYLEDVIALSRRTQTKVYTIGNAAIFGQKTGYVQYTFEDGSTDQLPVDQGPESAFPDGLQMPFVGSGNDWKLRQMSASYGPYALTRLCAETGGLFLITEESKGYAFDRAVMRRYAPDYRPIRIQEQEILKNPAKASLVSVAKMTYDNSLPNPQLVFRAYNDNILRTELTEAQKLPAEAVFTIRRMFEALKIGEQARGTLKEDRWCAAFDLAMGRLLAMQVRYFGYNQMLANMKVSPKPFPNDKDNMWRLVPSDKIESGPEMRKAAEQAKVYLTRVMDEHPGTPWALLAEKELSFPLGWTWESYSEPIPGSMVLRANDQEVARLLLADEEKRMEAAKKRPQVRRATPKL